MTQGTTLRERMYRARTQPSSGAARRDAKGLRESFADMGPAAEHQW